MQIGRPELLEVGVWKSGRGEIVRQSFEPDVGRLDVAGASFAREGNTPRESASAGRNVVQPGVDQRKNLVAPRLGLQKLLGRDERLQAIRVGAEPEEPV